MYILLAVAIAFIVILSASAASQTRAYYSFQRLWGAYWPFRRGRGLPRLVRPLLKRSVPIWVQIEPGIKILSDPDDLISRKILETGVWDEATWRAIEGHLSKGDTFIDVGAHEGYCSLKAARVVGPSGHVIAIEANPEMVRTLRGNIQASGTGVVTVVPVACSDSESTLDLFVAEHSNSGNSSLSERNASLAGTVRATYHVPARSLDAILQESRLLRVDVVKIDVEGAELLVLKGAEETLVRSRPILFVELDDLLLSAMGTCSAEIVSFLASRGYAMRGSYDDANFEFYPVTGQAPGRLECSTQQH